MQGNKIVSTFGLISRGKGIEDVITAMKDVVTRHPDVLYLVLGQTHPNVRAYEGESYRASLLAMVEQLGLQNHVRFVNSYLTQESLLKYLAATDIYITPYPNPGQISSGTLTYALAFAALETENTDLLRRVVQKLLDGYRHYSDRDWHWCEPVVTYENARLPQALFVAAHRLHHAEGIEVAHQTLQWLIEKTFVGEYHRPIGNHGWLVKGGSPAQWDQQPVDAGAMVEACAAAYVLSQEPLYRDRALLACEWYLGRNDHGLRVYEPETGFCHDALTPHGLNLNGGAESVLSYTMAHLRLQRYGLLPGGGSLV